MFGYEDELQAKIEKQEFVLRQFLRYPNWWRVLHDADCLPMYDENDPETCRCDGAGIEEKVRELFPELREQEFLE